MGELAEAAKELGLKSRAETLEAKNAELKAEVSNLEAMLKIKCDQVVEKEAEIERLNNEVRIKVEVLATTAQEVERLREERDNLRIIVRAAGAALKPED